MIDAPLNNSIGPAKPGDSTTQHFRGITRSSHLAPCSSAIPSRHDNPFATCWTKPGAIAFRFDDGQSAEQLVVTLASRNWMGAIVGPHGCGKSTLLESLKPALIAAGCHIHSITLRDGQRRLPRDFVRRCRMMTSLQKHPAGDEKTSAATPQVTRILVVVDGFEQLGWFDTWQLKSLCKRHSAGLLVTSHRPCGFCTLIHVSPDRKLIGQLVADLCREMPSDVTAKELDASYACHGSNVREIFFDLYDRHERLRRTFGIVDSATHNDCPTPCQMPNLGALPTQLVQTGV